MADEVSTSPTPTSSRLTRVEVEGLFDLFNNRVELRLEDRVTILHGLNGVGKTVILRMIDAFFDGDYMEYESIPFRLFRLTFLGGGTVELRRSQEVDHPPMLTIASTVPGTTGTIDHSLQASNLRRARLALHSIRGLIARDEDEWFDRRGNRTLTTAAAWKAFRRELPPEMRKTGLFDDPTWLRHVRRLGRVHFIETQRLLRFKKPDRARLGRDDGMVHGVVECAEDLSLRMLRANQNYGKVTQSLDQSFPQRLLRGVAPLEIATIQERLTQLDQRQDQLRDMGMLPMTSVRQLDRRDLNAMEPAHQAVMTLYLEDTEKKLAVFSQLQKNVSLLLASMNKKLYPNKTLVIDFEDGLILRDRHQRALPLSVLSSGEQHELVLFYDLLFNVHENGLVLIDEPELSLHVEWQKSFLPDLLAVVQAAHFDVILATHSPFIVGDRSDLMEGLPTETLNAE